MIFFLHLLLCSRYVYKRLRWTGNKNASLILTLVVISFWHRLWLSYHLNFMFEFIGLLAERTVSVYVYYVQYSIYF